MRSKKKKNELHGVELVSEDPRYEYRLKQRIAEINRTVGTNSRSYENDDDQHAKPVINLTRQPKRRR